MGAGGISPDLLRAWLAGRSLARQLPSPVAAGSGFRVETDSEAELRRWVFPAGDPDIARLARIIANPREPIKACILATDLAGFLPSQWDVQASGYFMRFCDRPAAAPVPDGFVARVEDRGAAGMVEITDEAGELAARGFWGQDSDAFVYDRIVVEPGFRRCGLGRGLMGLIGQHWRDDTTPQLLVATAEGRLLYHSLGWEVLSPYSTAFWRPVKERAR
ncbi:GNAT family N-acetyltransferase [Alteriqipengyuania lutimaris]|uniref:N-acetyltransferase n=1 Tax=Alteriqipengyuania lutimaris TaxID=1538146 RepID=A0A395LNF1_9SPHN|nr:GNAT family N-acetyltransferase [Alteriqipengyuania lutimaris]MBB3032713.1 GNAT superfamily N-acetyltransferase [Alteriqipengyuania lutimaris]RDS78179.1 N-acetyltransferase [Alteriqipengyuania lutimaris]